MYREVLAVELIGVEGRAEPCVGTYCSCSAPPISNRLGESDVGYLLETANMHSLACPGFSSHECWAPRHYRNPPCWRLDGRNGTGILSVVTGVVQ